MAEADFSKVGADGSRCTPSGASLTWNPLWSAFRPYVSPAQSSGEYSPESRGSDTNNLRKIVKKSLVPKVTKGIVETFQACNPAFRYSESLNPKRFLTNPSTGVLNDGFDNANSDLILYVNFELVNSETKGRYIVKDALGQGTFGQVAKCWDLESNKYVAVKIIKNQPAYYQQAVVEFSILDMLNKKYDPDDKHHIVRILDYFVFHRHLCISFEMLGSNLYELIKMNHFKGLPLNIVQAFSKQILHALVVMKDAGIIHCDMKPENILISTRLKPPQIKVIDFGSACVEGRTVYSYIQSRYYRSPEVLLGYPYTTSIDMWSFGCIVAELFLGLPLFPGASEYDLLNRMTEILGGQPPDSLLRDAKNTSKFFKHVGSIHRSEHDGTSKGIISAYHILTEDEYESRESKKPAIGKHYFNYVKLDDIIANYPYRKNLSEKEKSKESLTRLALVDFLRGLVEFDPGKRWSPLQASGHPFVTGDPFERPYKPPPESPRIPVMHTVTVDHNPGGGHWLAAGLSPQVSSVNKYLSQSPHFHKVPMSYGSSYGSFGSHGSYNDNTGLESNYGSYGDINTVHAYNSALGPSGFNMHVQVGGPFLGASPDARQRSQLSHGNGYSVSPYGGLGPMSLGVSPSQFTPPSSQMQISSASPGKYGPTSPVRGGTRGISLGKAAVVGQYNKRSVAYPTMCMQSYGSASEHGQGFCSDGMTSNYSEAQSPGHGGSHIAILVGSHSNWRQQMGGANGSCSLTSANLKGYPASYMHNSSTPSSHRSEVSFDKTEVSSSSVPHPGEWDPGYSDESLLEEDNIDSSSLRTEFANCTRLDDRSDAASLAGGNNRYSLGHNQARVSSKFLPSNQRTDGLRQAYSLAEGPSTSPDTRGGNGRPPQFSQNLPSRFGQQSIHRYNYMNPTIMHSERSHQHGQPAHLNYNITDSHSSTNAMLSNSMPWGRRGGHPMTTTLPMAHSRKDYGKI